MEIDNMMQKTIRDVNKNRVRGTVLINKALELSEHFSLEILREKGAVLTVQQLHEDTQYYLTNIHSQPKAEEYLKLISSGIQELKQSWKNDKMYNPEAEVELDKDAVEMLSIRWHNTSKSGAENLPVNIQELVHGKVQKILGAHYELWMAGEMDESILSVSTTVDNTIQGKLWPLVAETGEHVTSIVTNCLIEDYKTGNNMSEEFRNLFTATLVQDILNKVDNDVRVKGHESFSDELVSVIETMPLSKQFGKVIKNAISTLVSQWQSGLAAPDTQASILGWVENLVKRAKVPADYSSQIESRAFQTLLAQFKNAEIDNIAIQGIFEEQVKVIAGEQLRASYKDSAEFTKHIDNIVMSEIVIEWKEYSEESTLNEAQMQYLNELFTSKLSNLQKSIMDVTSTSKLSAEVKDLRSEVDLLRTAVTQLFKIHGKELPSYAKSHGALFSHSRGIEAHIVNVTLKPENNNNNQTTTSAPTSTPTYDS